ncbi:integral membrane protein GPR137 [Rhinatrema bivittatum]|uniref:integral membrane protein GPR137 n=1 Tax=Rhinatrema bivittatum TaxID=194408 RepID=UPI001128E56A|nr:integral membrane protein GPR137 [Rhinatrema bivittatum]
MEKGSSFSNLTEIIPAEHLRPAFPPVVKLGLTSIYTALYALLFFFVYVQLWMVLLYRHKTLSYQTVFLSLCLLWAALRTTLFSFYFKNTVKANRLHPFLFWLLYCCPVCLQFFTLSLMTLYFAQVVFKAKAKFQPEMTKGLLGVRAACLLASLVFLSVNMVCAFLVKIHDSETWTIVLVRVLINDTLFVLCAIFLACFLYMVAKMSPSTSIYLESKGTTVCQTTVVGGAVILLSASRACYNLVALALTPHTRMDAFGYDWYNVSDQADLITDLGDKGYLVFGLILFIWELLPTALLVGFFRVRRPAQDLSSSRIINGPISGSRAYFFDNPHQLEGDLPAPWMSSSCGEYSRGEHSSLSGSLQNTSWYGSISRGGSGDHSWLMPARTVPLLFSRDHTQSSHHHSLYSTPQT